MCQWWGSGDLRSQELLFVFGQVTRVFMYAFLLRMVVGVKCLSIISFAQSVIFLAVSFFKVRFIASRLNLRVMEVYPNLGCF